MTLSKSNGADKETLGKRLRSVRKERGWTQEQLAVQAGTSQAVIQKIENGKSLRPRKIDIIARVLEVDPAWLMFGTGQPNGLDQEAREIALAWRRLPEDKRTLLRDQILRAARYSSLY
jgi:transcriptional regulator with XRE-family HTH domain